MAEAITISSELADLKARQPFKPFSIVMTSGDRFEVLDSEKIVIFSTAVVVFSLNRGGHATLHLRQISSIEAYERP